MRKKRRQWVTLGVLLGGLLALGIQAQEKRVVRGQVLDRDSKAVATAIVHLKNTTTKKQFSVATDKEGRYQFNDVDMKADYELYAEWQGQKSRTRKVSQFDTRAIVRVNLRLEPTEKNKPKKERKQEKD